MAKRRTPPTFSEQLREVILAGPMSRYEIAKQSGVDASQLHRFVNATGRLTNDSIDKLAAVLNLQLQQGK